MARLLLLLYCLLGIQAAAADRWIRITSPHFELYTPGGEKRGRETVVFFEKLLDFFTTNVHLKAGEGKIRVVLFKGEKDYAPYKTREFAEAYYVPGYDGDYIVLHSTGSESIQTLVHEFTHLVVHHSGLELPAWLNEGLAEVYATFKPMGDKVQVGDLHLGRMQVLRENKWLDLPSLLRVDHNSPYYNESKRANVFYAEAWALTHMLQLDDAYRGKTPKLIVDLMQGTSPEDAFRSAYGKSLAEIQKDLQRYMSGNQFHGALFSYKMPKQAEESQTAPMSELEAEVLQCRLLEFAHKTNDAAKRLTELAKENPKEWLPEAALGELMYHQHKPESAVGHFAKASALGANDARMYLDYAMTLRGRDKEAAEALTKAVELKPDYTEAQYHLAFLRMRLHQYGSAMAAFNAMKKVKQEQAFFYYSGRAHAEARLGMFDAALKDLAGARKYAKELSEKAEVEQLASYVEEARKPRGIPAPASRTAAPVRSRVEDDVPPRLERRGEEPERKPLTPLYVPPPTVEGTLREVGCESGKLTLVIESGGQARRFAVPEPDKVAIKNHEGGSVEFTCGKQKPRPIAVELGPAGDVKVIEFR